MQGTVMMKVLLLKTMSGGSLRPTADYRAGPGVEDVFFVVILFFDMVSSWGLDSDPGTWIFGKNI